MGRRRGPSDLERHQGGGHEADGAHRRRLRDTGAGNQESEAGVGDPSEDHPSAGGKGRQVSAAAANAEAGTATPVAVRPAAGEPARTQSPARPAAWRARQPQHERRPVRTGADCPGQGREHGRAPRRSTRPLGPLVKVHRDREQHENPVKSAESFTIKVQKILRK